MSVKIISKNKKTITLEVTIDIDNENFLQTEELIMDKVNEVGQTITKEAMENLDIKESVKGEKIRKCMLKKNKKISNSLWRNRGK
jgi:hypothetical protein